MNGSIDYMKLAAIEELKDALKTKQINDELLEYLSSSLRYLLHYSNKYAIPLPERETILSILDRIMDVSKELPIGKKHNFPPTEFHQRNKTTEDETEPIIIITLNIKIKFYKYEDINQNIF